METYRVDKHRDLGEDARNQTVERLHPVALEQEVAVDVEVAALVVVDFSAEGFLHVRTVQVLADPVELVVTQAATLTFATDVIDVLAGALIRANHGVVAID